MKDYQKSLDNFLEALYKYKEFGKPFLIANAYRDVATINYKLNRFDVAIKTLDSALVIYEQLKKEYSIAQAYDLMSLLYIKKGNSLKAINYILKGIDISKKNHFMDLLNESYRSLSDIYVEQNDYKNAYQFHVLYADAKDSLVNHSDETMENINSMQSKFDKEKKEQEKLLHEAVVAQKEAKLEQEKTQRYALYGGLGLVIAFSIFVFNRFRITQKQNIIIEQQKQMVDAAFKTLEEKNKEVMASITYAQRIQRALITSELYIEKQLNRLIKGDNNEP
jgi:tetratricopeptide (TPR) repeat protein